MPRSTGLPRQKGLMGITHVVRARTRAVTVSRVTESKGSLDETNTSTTDHSEDIWLYEPRESIASEITGERVEGSLGGLVIADGTVDIEKDDRITHGGVVYEVDTIVGHPEDGEPGNEPDTDFWVVSFVRRQS